MTSAEPYLDQLDLLLFKYNNVANDDECDILIKELNVELLFLLNRMRETLGISRSPDLF